ncbi:Tripeptidyl aminopeptidase [Fusarium albosuccineum]|uniref:Tripeptidyl aminopeptidase n=1 Tax=Fusarium albosuccineum TaxID=1237068 RepID=A0A8H4P347_9HYPO|nr:Tripeptidyl aminopeptidase [Fusarium albosuccineum]
MRSHNIILTGLTLGIANSLAVPSGSTGSRETSTLNWVPCDLDFSDETKARMTKDMDCATLEVPLDYTAKNTGRTIDIQLLRAKANKKPFRGSVLGNPGGPGGSGVEWVAEKGPAFRDRLGGHFHFIGFDPRCENATATVSSRLSKRDNGFLPQADPWPLIRDEVWQEMGQYADTCYEKQRETGHYIGTAAVARDMLSIVDALNEDGKLRYWGISYGSILGQVFASMFPSRVDRFMLDSVMLADEFLINTVTGTLRDADESLLHVFSECVNGGPKSCVLANYAGPKTTAEDLRVALQKLFEELIRMPALPPDIGIPEVSLPHGGTSLLFTLKSLIFACLLGPKTYPNAVEIICFALKGKWKNALSAAPEPTSPASQWNIGADAFFGIGCSDSSFRAESAEDLYSVTQAHLSQSSFADMGVALMKRLHCARWRFRAAEQIDTNKLRNIHTSYPILFVNGKYDPVTPLSHAWEASARFRGSRVLVHEGVGHVSTSHPSNCTLQAIAEYFMEGKLPDIGTICKPDMPAFEYAENP